MIAISTKTRAVVEVDGAKFTVRPMTGAEKLEASEHSPMAYWVAKQCTVCIDNASIDGRPATAADMDLFEPNVAFAIFAEVAKLSGLTRDDAKNSPSRPVSSPVESAT